MARRIPALTIWRPWTTCIVRYGKTVENREWATRYRGPIWIHAGKRFDPDALAFASRLGVGLSGAPADHPTGIVALAQLVDVLDCELGGATSCGCGPWAIRYQYHWRLANVRPVTPVECNGAQGLWYPATNLTDQAAFLEAADA